MKKHNYLFIILLSVLFSQCDHKKKEPNTEFSFDITLLKEQFQPQETAQLKLTSLNAAVVDSIVFYNNDEKIGTKKGLETLTIDFKNQKLGYQNLKAIVFYEGETAEATHRVELVSNVQPKLLKFKIIATYKHDKTSFTEGLELHNDTIYESTGLKGESYFRKYNYKTGAIYSQVNLDSNYFGEGITVINNQILQLTWQEKTGFIYDAKTLKLVKKFSYDKDIEGWGMTNDGKFIYQSDGTEKLWKMNPDTQKMIEYVNVYAGSAKIKSINELEWIEGKIYANVWQKDAIAVINPKNGIVEAIIDLSSLRKLIPNTADDVLNGIAYNAKTKTIFVTGKKWDKLFEIKVFE